MKTKLPAMTFGQLRMLARAGTRLRATIRRADGRYLIEMDVGPRRWVLVSTHGKRPRMFHHLDGAANAVRNLCAQEVVLDLSESDSSAVEPAV